MALELTIAGVSKNPRGRSIDLLQVINGRDSLRCAIDSSDGSYRPAESAVVALTEDGSPLFGGVIEVPRERGAVNVGAAIVTDITCADFSAYTKRRKVKGTIPAGTVKAALHYIVDNYLTGYGVTVHASQADGDTLPALTFDDTDCGAALDLIAKSAGNWVWSINASKALRAWAPGSIAASFNVTEGNLACCGDMEVIQGSRANYANRIILRCGNGTHLDDQEQVFTQVGSEVEYVTTYPASSDINDTWPQLLIVNGSVEAPIGWGPNSLPPGVSWYWDYENHKLINDTGTPLSPGDEITVRYAASSRIVVEDVSEQVDPIGVWDAVVNAPDASTVASALLLGAAVLTERKTVPYTVVYPTRNKIAPGEHQTITAASRGVTGTHLVTDVRATDDVDGTLRRTVTAVKGLVPQPTFRDKYKQWYGAAPAGSVSGAVSSTGSGSATPAVYFLGGHASEWWQSPDPDWIPLTGPAAEGGVRARIDSASRASRSATVYLRARVSAGTLTIRLWDVTNEVPVGTSVVISSTTLESVPIAVTLSEGVAEYELQGLPSLADTDVQIVGGYLQ